MGLGLRILHMLLNRPRAFTWYFSQNFHVRNYEVFFLCSPLNNSCRIFTPMALSRRVEHSGGLRLSLSGTVRSWSSFYDLSGARSYLPPFLSIFCIVSRLSEQRLGNHSEKVFFDMHSGRLSVCSISTDDSYLIFDLYFCHWFSGESPGVTIKHFGHQTHGLHWGEKRQIIFEYDRVLLALKLG